MAEHGLERYRIVDMGRTWAGPLAATILADMGAEVIKVESRKFVDPLRMSPDNLTRDPNRDPWFHSGNRNKFSVTIDIACPKGVDLLKKLVGKSDVLIENFSPGVMERLGLGYESLREVNQRIIMVSMPAAGLTGPMRDVVGYAPSLHALSGFDSMVGYPGEPPLGLQYVFSDCNAAAWGALAVLIALYDREQTGVGRHIELSQLEAILCCLPEGILEYVLNGVTLSTMGNYRYGMAPHNNYRCKGDDKWVSIAIATEEEWRSFCAAIGNPHWTEDSRFANRSSRTKYQEELDQYITSWTINHTHYEVMNILQQFSVAAMPCLDMEERYLDPHFQERECYIQYADEETGVHIMAGIPWKLSETPGEVLRRAPLLGEHNGYVFGELLGLPEEEVEQLTNDKVIY